MGSKRKEDDQKSRYSFSWEWNLADFEKTEKPKATVEGVLDLTPTSSSSNNATNREEVQDENYGDEPTEFDVDEPIGVDGDDVKDTDGVEQREQPLPLKMVEP